MDKNTALDNLTLANTIFRLVGVKFFLANGTLLGRCRENDFIDHDLDVDLGVFFSDFKPELFSMMIASGFELFKVYGSHADNLQYSFMRNGQKLDVFFYYTDGRDMWHGIFNGNESGRYVFPRFELEQVKFKGLWVYIPKDYDTYLTAQYGDWRTPVKEWHWWNSPKNRV